MPLSGHAWMEQNPSVMIQSRVEGRPIMEMDQPYKNHLLLYFLKKKSDIDTSLSFIQQREKSNNSLNQELTQLLLRQMTSVEKKCIQLIHFSPLGRNYQLLQNNKNHKIYMLNLHDESFQLGSQLSCLDVTPRPAHSALINSVITCGLVSPGAE